LFLLLLLLTEYHNCFQIINKNKNSNNNNNNNNNNNVSGNGEEKFNQTVISRAKETLDEKVVDYRVDIMETPSHD
jgi:hypothetical protein